MPASRILFLVLLAAQLAAAHMSPYTSSMYGMWTDNDPFMPIGPGWDFDDWWFRGPPARNMPPADGELTLLPAGGTIMIEIACHIAWTSLGWRTTDNVACPNSIGAYHAGDPNAAEIDESLVAGCALGIANVEAIEDVTVDNLAIFSVQQNCVNKRDTYFDVPAQMPACTGRWCMCAWFWEPKMTANYYQTAFRCDVTGSPVTATAISTPLKDTKYCPNGGCVTGARRPMYVYNNDYMNTADISNAWRPGYHDSWGWKNGAQNDIFMTAAQFANYVQPKVNPPVPYVPKKWPFTNDLALHATATASSSANGSHPSAAIDGIISGYMNPGSGFNEAAEWVSDHEGAGAWLKLTWPTPITARYVVMYDRPNWSDYCKAGHITFSDGSVEAFGLLDNGGGGTPLTFTARNTTSITWTCTKTSVWSSNIGLAEFQVFGPTTPVSGVAATSSSASLSRTSVALGSSSSSSTKSSSKSSSTTRSSSSSSSKLATTTTSLRSTASLSITKSTTRASSSSGKSTSSSAKSTTSSTKSSSSSSAKTTTTTKPTTRASSSSGKSTSSSAKSTTSSTKSSSSSSAKTTTTTKPGSSSSSASSTKSSSKISTSALASTTKASPVSSSEPSSSSATPSSSATQKASSSSIQPKTTLATPQSSSIKVASASAMGSSSPSASPSSSTKEDVKSSSSPLQSSSSLPSAQSAPSSATGSPTPSSSSAVSRTSVSLSTSRSAPSTVVSSSPIADVGTFLVRDDLALHARAIATSKSPKQPPMAALDGILAGSDGDSTNEWVSNDQGVGAALKVYWSVAVDVSTIILYDRPELDQQILSGKFWFSDGSTALFGALNNDGSATVIPLNKTVSTTSILVYISQVSETTTSVGISEVGVFGPNPYSYYTSTPSATPAQSSATPSTSSVPASTSAAPLSKRVVEDVEEPVETVKVHARDWRSRAKALPKDKREALSANQAAGRRRQLMADVAHNRPADF